MENNQTSPSVGPDPTTTSQEPPQQTPIIASAPSDLPREENRLSKMRSWLMKGMLGCLVAAALVAVIAILAGSWDSTAWRAIGTVFAVMFHIFVLLGVLSSLENTGTASNPALERSANLVLNSSMIITVLSFFTAVFNIWGVVDGEIAFKLYVTYGVALFVILHTRSLLDIGAVNQKVMPYIYGNWVFMGIVSLLILGLVWVDGISSVGDGFYWRLLAAAAVIDFTLSVMVAVMQRMFLQKHPELAVQQGSDKKTNPIGAMIVAILLFFFVGLPLMISGMSLWN